MTGARREALADLLRRYGAAFSHAWRERRRLTPPTRLAHEAEFLPAALALRETPVSPAPRVAMWLLMGFAAIALLWSVFGRIDMVATAHGKIVPGDRTKVIQPVDTAKVVAIHVRDGQPVKAGQVLVALDATETAADRTRIANDLLDARLQSARARALLAAIAEGTPPSLPGGKDIGPVSAERLARERRLVAGQFDEYLGKLGRVDAEIARREAELASTRQIVAKLAQTVPIARRRAEDFKGLVAQKFISEHGYLEKEQSRIEQEGDLATQTSRLDELAAALRESRNQRTALVAESRRLTLESLAEAEQKIATLTQERVKAESRNRLMTLVAPVDGTVQQLAVHTVGGVVTEAQALMVVVPTDEALEVEAFLENKDIGFVRAGQEAVVKIETFPFTKYGTVPAAVAHVSDDAIADEKKGLMYSSRVRLERTTIAVDERMVNLSPGMAVTVEIKTGQRRVIEYFLSPLLQYRDESLRER